MAKEQSVPEPYRVAIVGARRGLHHASAYAGLEERARVVALAELDEERRAAAAARLGPTVRTYAGWQEMLTRERPDVLHVVTQPTLPRAQWVRPAAAAGVQVLALEKPIAIRPSEAAALSQAVAQTGLKVAVNHQRRYMPFADRLLELLANEETGLGPVQFVRASTYGPILDMSTHLLDLVLLALGDSQATHVWATAEGVDLTPHNMCPRQMVAEFTFANGARAFYEASPTATPPFGSRDFRTELQPAAGGVGPHRCNIDVWAERGRFWWREWGTWGYDLAGFPSFRAPTAMDVDDGPAQHAYTLALLDWLEGASHRCRYALAQRGFDLLLGAYRSAWLGRRLGYPDAAALTDDENRGLLDRLQRPSA